MAKILTAPEACNAAAARSRRAVSIGAEWIEGLPREFRQRDMVQDVFRTLGQYHPEMAVRMLDDPAVMQKLFGSGNADVRRLREQ